VYIPGTPTVGSRPQTPVLTAATAPTSACTGNTVSDQSTDISTTTSTQDKEVVKEYLEQNQPSDTKQEVSISQEGTQTGQQKIFSQIETSSEKIMSFKQSSLQQEQVSGRLECKTEEQSLGHVAAPAYIIKPAQTGHEQSGAFPFTNEDISQEHAVSSKTSQYNSSSIQETSVQYSNVYRQTEVMSEDTDTLYEAKPIKSLIQTFEESSRPPMKYKQIRTEGANIVKNIPAQQTRKSVPLQAPTVNGNIYYVASAHVETRQFTPQQAELTTQKVTGYGTSETQFQKYSSFSSSEQQESLITQKGHSSSTQTFQSKSLQSSAVNQHQLLTQITGKTADFYIFLLIFFLQEYFFGHALKGACFLHTKLTLVFNN
jgi:hypothetical protein